MPGAKYNGNLLTIHKFHLINFVNYSKKLYFEFSHFAIGDTI